MKIEIPRGFKFYSGNAGFYSEDRPDILIIVAEEGCSATGVLTTNKLRAAPVRLAEEMLKKYRIFSGALINTGFANAATGKRGISDAQEILDFGKKVLDLPYPLIPASTGVIGSYLPLEKIKKALESLNKHDDLELAARSIMTTDSFPKFYSVKGSKEYCLAGITKGAGMIGPSLATTLTFVMTDADFSPYFLKKALLNAVQKTFNKIAVDGEQSTNDAIFLFSTGKIKVDKSMAKEFEILLVNLLYELSMKILRDGEGATKIIKVITKGFASKKDAENVAKRVALSPLVKTAVYGSDPNWGRIFACVGDSNSYIEEDRLRIFIGDYPVFKGEPVDFNRKELSDYLKGDSIEIVIDANLGKHESYFFSCDLSEKYVEINSSYTS
ncbi:MAG: bifunctional glutamate N-acetyltransferase/amino-acid acetyltransferase ArgJ [Actinobacteria bacterium]|nr:bifunctional glutamate N-acetyltransferase/amino-acid acetyltransferase ArgJ [Actinomycetota bacterium]